VRFSECSQNITSYNKINETYECGIRETGTKTIFFWDCQSLFLMRKIISQSTKIKTSSRFGSLSSDIFIPNFHFLYSQLIFSESISMLKSFWYQFHHGPSLFEKKEIQNLILKKEPETLRKTTPFFLWKEKEKVRWDKEQGWNCWVYFQPWRGKEARVRFEEIEISISQVKEFLFKIYKSGKVACLNIPLMRKQWS